MPLELMILTPDQQTKRLELKGSEISLGRAHGNDLSYPDDASLSRRHLRLTLEEHGWAVEDLKSKNGTLLNGSRIASKRYLSAGDRLAAGHLLMTLVDSENASASNVVFVPEDGQDLAANHTVMTSLEGLLSGEATTPALMQPSPGAEAERGHSFNSPVVRALVRAGRELSGNRPLDELFPLILDLSISAVNAERGVVMMLDGGELTARATHGEGFRISTTVRDRVLQEKTSVLVRDLDQDEAFRQQLSISGQQIHTMMAVPLQTEDRVLGLIYVDSRSFVREFTQDELNLLTVLANVAAIRVEQARLAEVERREQVRTRDLNQAAEIQRGILPDGAPKVPHLDLFGHNAPSRTVGGDYYDFLDYEDGRVAIVLGDVAGKGMSAALLMSNLQARVQLLGEDHPTDLARLVSRLDQSVAANCPTNRFITFFYGLIDPNEQRLCYCNAGHNPPIIVRADGSIETLTAAGTVLGMLPELGYEEHCTSFAPGDLIAVFSDGVTEAETPNEEEFGEQRLADLLASLREEPLDRIVATILQKIDDFTHSAPPADDVTLLVARHAG